MTEPVSLSRRGAVLAAVGALSAPRLAIAAKRTGAWAAIDGRIDALIADKTLAGGQVAVARRGALLYSRGFGAANLETRTPADTKSIFRFASNTKQFTAAAILSLQEAGLLSVDDRLAKYLPQVPRAADITLRQMLGHVSGLGDYVSTPDPHTMFQRARTDYTPAELLDHVLKTTDPLFIGEPGEQFAYSNTAFVMLGLVIEKASGRPYAEVVSPLFRRAGLTRTAVDDASDVVTGRASGYALNEGAPSGFSNASFISMTYTFGAGSIRSTCEDFCRWHAALFGGRILKPESLRLMLEPARRKNGQLLTMTNGPSGDGKTAPPAYGLGLVVRDDAHGRLYSHGGAVQGFSSWTGTYPDVGVNIAMITNTDRLAATGKTVASAMDSLRTAITAAIFG
jgi:CubicO group peptidase (beta-lactamase class C family)